MRKLLLALIVLPACAFAAPEYRPGWTAANFYSEVAACQAAVTLPALQAYDKRGLAAGRGEEAMRSETISMAPVLQAGADDMCYCAFNELAKDITYASFTADKAKMQGYVNGHCKADAQKAMTRQAADDRRLK